MARYIPGENSIKDAHSGRTLYVGQKVDIPSTAHILGQEDWEVQEILGGQYGMVLLGKQAPGHTAQFRVPMLNCVAQTPAPGSQEFLDVGAGEEPHLKTREHLEKEAEALARATGSVSATVTHEYVFGGGRRVYREGSWARPSKVLYAAGTLLKDIKEFAGMPGATFRCPQHKAAQWRSMDPWNRAWAPLGIDKAQCPRSCTVETGDLELLLDYEVTPKN